MEINQKFHFKIRELLKYNLQETLENKINIGNLILKSSDLRVFESEFLNFIKFNDCENIIRKEIERKTQLNTGFVRIDPRDNPISRKDLIIAYELVEKKPFTNTSLFEDFNKLNQEVLLKAITISQNRNFNQLIDLKNRMKEFNINSTDSIYIETLIDKKSIFNDVEMKFLELPEEFSKEDLKSFLSKNTFESYFSSEDYKYFLSNSFKLFAETDSPLVLSIKISKKGKREIPKKLYILYSMFSNLKSENPDIDLKKENYGLLLMRNFSEFRKSNGYNFSFKNILENATKTIRK